MRSKLAALLLIVCPLLIAQDAKKPEAQENAGSQSISKAIPAGSKIYIAAMDNGFQDALSAAITKKKVPLQVVASKDNADFEVSGTSETQKAGAAKIILMGNWHSREEASIRVTNLKSGVVAFAYSYHNDASAHGKQSAAEACAKHLKEKIEKDK
jgi:hypothetical protein